jgi:hypothetical protein
MSEEVTSVERLIAAMRRLEEAPRPTAFVLPRWLIALLLRPSARQYFGRRRSVSMRERRRALGYRPRVSWLAR